MTCLGVPLLLLCHNHRKETDANAALCFRSLLSNLCKLTLSRVAVSLPALQPVATRLRELNVSGSRLQGSAEGFLTKGWTALTSLALSHTRMDRTILTATLELPALGDAHICWFRGHQDGELELDQLTGGCPQVSRLVFKLAKCWQHFSQASRQRCSLLNLSRLADLQVMSDSLQDIVDLDLPPSLTQLRFQGEECCSGAIFELSWALREAVKCIGQGAQLQKLVCNCEGAFLEPAQWDPSLDEQHTRLGGQLSGLRELEVWCAYEQLLSAVGAVASAAPSLTRLHIVIRRELPRVEVPPICSASLESIRVDWGLSIYRERPPPQVLLTFLPGCTRLQEVVVHFMGGRVKGAAVNIRGHCCNRGYIEPVDGYASFDKSVLEEMYAGVVNGVAVKFRHMPSPELGAEECTILCTCHAAEPGQASLWGHAVMPGIL